MNNKKYAFFKICFSQWMFWNKIESKWSSKTAGRKIPVLSNEL